MTHDAETKLRAQITESFGQKPTLAPFEIFEHEEQVYIRIGAGGHDQYLGPSEEAFPLLLQTVPLPYIQASLTASAIEARSDETATQAQPEGRERGGEAETPKV